MAARSSNLCFLTSALVSVCCDLLFVRLYTCCSNNRRIFFGPFMLLKLVLMPILLRWRVVDPYKLLRAKCFLWCCSTILVILIMWNAVSNLETFSFDDRYLGAEYLLVSRLVDILTLMFFLRRNDEGSIVPVAVEHRCTFRKLVKKHLPAGTRSGSLSCCICLKKFSPDDMVAKFRCQHVSHLLCAETWERRQRHIQRRRCCPMLCGAVVVRVP
eukprot:TRINITY_DN59611_c0_g1_i1.p1 TRINITY_DN59611_c0_g1~~TRINITY_DN59611_c0_g1_i1.p1  ORF type:complete len:233 (+),score=10.28 TRINITY_DN59611_c0_g1_i1:59-700(+)